MPTVMIDGVAYAPAGNAAPRIGIGIKTRNRNDIVANTAAKIRQHTPGAKIVIIDDASTNPVEGAAYRFEKNVGIAQASNKALELLQDCEHIFLFDDDTYPLVDEWWRPYVESAEPHLMWIFDRPAGVSKRQVEVLYQDEKIVAHHATRGCMLYIERRVLDVVGGMDPAFGTWGWEHQSWSDRIHAAGLTTARYMDVPNSAELIHSMDQHQEIKSTATDAARRFSEGPGLELRMQSRHDPAYIEYRQLEDVVLTTMLTSQPDPQRGKPMQADARMVKALHDSITTHRLVVLTTGLADEKSIPRAELVPVTQQINPYFERWAQIYRWLRARPEIGRVWCVDATDVTMLRNPFPEMEPGILYFGYEAATLRDEWMRKHHPDTTLQTFMSERPNVPLLNMGVVGGDRETVMAFAQKVLKFYFDDHIDWIMGWETQRVGVGDMAAGNYVARTEFADRSSSGPHVTNPLKSPLGVKTAWWAHKATG